MPPQLVIRRNLTLRPDRVQPEPWFQPAETFLRHRRAFSISLSEMPFDRAQDSTVASPYRTTAFLTTQQEMPWRELQTAVQQP